MTLLSQTLHHVNVSIEQGTLDSVNQLASQTYDAFKKEGTGSRESLTSSQLSLSTLTGSDQPGQGQDGGNGVLTSSQSDLLSYGSPAGGAATGTMTSSASSGAFFSLGDDDEPVSLSNANSPTKTPTPAANNSGKTFLCFLHHNQRLCQLCPRFLGLRNN